MEVTMKMALKTLSVGELRSPNSTARQHNRQQRKKARALFSEHGIVVPIIVDEHMRIIDGILRFEIAKEPGLQELNAVVVSDANEEELLQLELSLNRLAEDGAWDTERLKSKFEQLIEYNVDLTFTGFETAEIDNILSFEVIEPEDQNWTATDPVTQVGDIWQVGDHIIACGNELSPDEVLGDVLDGLELAKACITDPPYNVPTAGHIRTTQKHAEFAMAAGEMDEQDFTEFLSRSITASLPYMDTTALYYLFMDWRHVGNLNAAAKYNGLIQQNLCVWSKTNAGMGSFYRSQHELVGVYSRSDLIRDLQKRANGQLHIKGVPHQNLSKEARLDLVLYLINAGRVRLLEEEKSLDLLLHQLRQFPNGKYDDLVDSFTQALRVLPTLGSGKAVWRIS